MKSAGMVARSPHANGSVKSAIMLRIMKIIQKIFRCTLGFALVFSNHQHAGSTDSVVLQRL